jgi:glycosyltransferase involved in cell wall biosynthesis
MNIICRPPLRIAVVATRDLAESNGRTPILSHIIRALAARDDVTVISLPTITEHGSMRDIAGALVCWLVSVLRGRPLPLQCLLYASPRSCRAVSAQIREAGCDVVYLDTVRCQPLLRLLRRSIPNLRIVTDFDDLMSRRARYLYQHRLPFSSGHAGRHFPRWLRFLADALLSRPIAFYESRTLPAAEAEVVAASDATVLISPADRDILKTRLPQGALHAIPPAVTLKRPPVVRMTPRRFIFIGSDNFVQNRTAIDFLVQSWRDNRPATPLHIYGRQSRPPIAVPGVYWHGFVEDLADVYQPGSIALAPALDRGGIKTKVLEAWAWGCPVLGNPAAFEGLTVGDYPLIRPEKDWTAILTAPQEHEAAWLEAARVGHIFVRDRLSALNFERAWEQIIDSIAGRAVVAANSIAAHISAPGAAAEIEPDLARTA